MGVKVLQSVQPSVNFSTRNILLLQKQCKKLTKLRNALSGAASKFAADIRAEVVQHFLFRNANVCRMISELQHEPVTEVFTNADL